MIMEKMAYSRLDATNSIACGDKDKDLHEEILRIKLILDNHNEKSDDAILIDSLRKLRNLRPSLSFDTLKATLIGKSVNALRKHGSKEIRNLVKTLIGEWKKTVNLWLDATDAIADPISCEQQIQNRGSDRSKPTCVEKNMGPDQPRSSPKNMKIKVVLKRKVPLEPNVAETETGAAKRTKYDSDPMLQQEGMEKTAYSGLDTTNAIAGGDEDKGTPKPSNYEDGGDGDHKDRNKEVLRIKGILDNYLEESDGTLLECLQKLQLLSVSFYTLKATMIGKSVSALRKHGSNEIQKLVRRLIEDWKKVVDSGLATNDMADPGSCEEGSDKSKPTCVEKMEFHKLKNKGPDEPRSSPKNMKIKVVLKRKAPLKPNAVETETGASKRSKYDSDQMLEQEMKFEAARKRLRERYQEVENAKKQRRILFEKNYRTAELMERKSHHKSRKSRYTKG